MLKHIDSYYGISLAREFLHIQGHRTTLLEFSVFLAIFFHKKIAEPDLAEYIDGHRCTQESHNKNRYSKALARLAGKNWVEITYTSGQARQLGPCKFYAVSSCGTDVLKQAGFTKPRAERLIKLIQTFWHDNYRSTLFEFTTFLAIFYYQSASVNDILNITTKDLDDIGSDSGVCSQLIRLQNRGLIIKTDLDRCHLPTRYTYHLTNLSQRYIAQ